MSQQVPELISNLADMTGGKLEECVNDVGDGSGFAVMSLPLPEDHWLYATTEDGFTPNPTYELLIGNCPARDYLEDLLKPGIQHGIKAATRCGRDEDFDPDALARNVVIGHFGVYTDDGLTGGEDAKLFNPPKPGSIKQLLTVISLAVSGGQIGREEVLHAISPKGLSDAYHLYQKHEIDKQAAYEEWRRKRGIVDASETTSTDGDNPPDPPADNQE